MELIHATDQLELNGLSYPGFPILVDDEMRSVTAANNFLRYHLLQRGRVASKASWRSIAQHLYDYFGFLEAYSLDWRETNQVGSVGILATYRDYCTSLCGLAPRTVNQRLCTIACFYKYQLAQGAVRRLPFEIETVVGNHGHQGFLGHLGGSTARLSPDVMLRVDKQVPRFLSMEQARSLLQLITNPTHSLMVRLGLQTGLRRAEIATFPTAYVKAPGSASGLVQVRLDPRDGTSIQTKGSRPRTIFMPATLMAALWNYRVHTRPTLAGRTEEVREPLFLTQTGQPWAEYGKGFERVFRRYLRRIGLSAGPHVLRHTYATHTLAALQANRTSTDPLVFLQRQLGHSSIQTTLIYAHLVDETVMRSVTHYDAEVTSWSIELA